MKTVIFIITVLSWTTPVLAACVAGQNGCASCASSNCIECLKDFRLASPFCYACIEGTWTPNVNSDVTCRNCDPGAAKCTSSSILDITYCLPGYYRSSSTGCVRCPVGTARPIPTEATGHETVSVCTVPCSEGAAACRGPNGGDVEYCLAGFYKMATGCVRCPLGKTRPAPTSAPSGEEGGVPCDLDCVPEATACTGTSAADATHCKAGYYKALTGCAVCPSGRGKTAHSLTGPKPDTETANDCDITCAPGIANCKTSSPSDANWCLPNYWWANGVCTACEEGKFKLATNGTPITFENPTMCGICTFGASRCVGASPADVTHCKAGYYKTNSGCLICPAGKGKPAHDVNAAAPASETEANCAACSDIKNLPAGSPTFMDPSCSSTVNGKSSWGSLISSLFGIILAAISLV